MARSALLAASAILAVLAGVAQAETDVSLNLSGAPGLIDMPSGAALAREHLSFSTTGFGAVRRSTIGFQAAPWLAASLRSTSAGDVFDRSLDLRFQLLTEGAVRPAVSIGLMDLLGPGVQSGEYIAATKHFGDRFSVTGGLGWGRLGSQGPIGAPLGPRPATDGSGGLRVDQLFTGDVAPFAGIEWRITDRWTLKGEVSSDAYGAESAVFVPVSPFNFGLEYQQSDMLRFGLYSMYGNQIGFAAQIILNPGQRPGGGIGGSGPTPVQPRVAVAQDRDAWSPDWVTQDGAQPILIGNLTTFLKRSGVTVEALSYTAGTAQVRIRNDSLDAEAQAIGRVARAMTHLMPASVEVFEIVPMTGGVPASKVVLRRSDIEALEFAPDNAEALRQRAVITDAGAPMANLAWNPDLYPAFDWSLRPYARLSFLEPELPVSGEVGLRLSARYDLAPGISLQGSLTKIGFSAFGAGTAATPGGLQPVRSDADLYRSNGDPALESLTASWHGRLGPDLYGRVTAGYLEPMFGGVSAEVLWMPTVGRLALGAEANLVAQRDTNGGLGFGEYSYGVASGHLSGYVDLGRGYHAQLDLGRYLAGDNGGTLTLTRRFENGWKLSAHSTLTDAPAGYGTDHGIRIEVPMSWITGQPVRRTRLVEFAPGDGDAGARLQVADRLYGLMIDHSATGLEEQWGRFWK